PDEIYHRPANAFVGTFIGSPSMNLLRGTLENRDGAITVAGNDWRMVLPPDLAGALEAAGRPSDVIVGCRPSHVRLSHDTSASGFPAEVYTIEPTGEVTYVHLRVGTLLLVAAVDPAFAVSVGDRVWVDFPTEWMHLFDGATERSILRDLPVPA
ncbi:MAG TPA: TOBE domain-containing protein, partial [Thermomicrobiales bacterium]|nr:TOBE domain-containing protein [Thermomicrobiales bacterium]